jgi:hypothetical protein
VDRQHDGFLAAGDRGGVGQLQSRAEHHEWLGGLRGRHRQLGPGDGEQVPLDAAVVEPAGGDRAGDEGGDGGDRSAGGVGDGDGHGVAGAGEADPDRRGAGGVQRNTLPGEREAGRALGGGGEERGVQAGVE